MDIPSWMQAAGLLLAAAGVGFLVGHVLELVLLRTFVPVVHKRKPHWDDAVTKAMHPGLSIAFAALAFSLAAVAIDASLDPLSRTWIRALTMAVVCFLVAFMLVRFVDSLVQARARRSPRWVSLANVVRPATMVTLYGLAALVVLASLGVQITPVLAGLGIGGLAVALALQDSLSNFFAGLWMRTSKDTRPGHAVRVEGSGVEGYVVWIGWRTTRLRTSDNNLVVVPNATLAKSVITNFHLPSMHKAIVIVVQVGYESDADQVTRVLLEEAKAARTAAPSLMEQPAPFVRLAAFGDWGLQFTLTCQVREYSDGPPTLDLLRRRVLARLRAEGIRLSYPAHDAPAARARQGLARPPAKTSADRAQARTGAGPPEEKGAEETAASEPAPDAEGTQVGSSELPGSG
jgi:small-conductance mechanosensitive channel